MAWFFIPGGENMHVIANSFQLGQLKLNPGVENSHVNQALRICKTAKTILANAKSQMAR